MADTVSVLTGGSNNFATTSEHLNALATDILSEGVVGTVGNTSGVAPSTGGLAVNAQGTPDMTVAVTAGVAYVTTTPTSQGSQLLRANIAAQNATIAANSTGGTRYDWIYVSMSASGAANPAVDGTGVATITVSRSTSSSTDNGTPPTYGYNIAIVTVTNGASSITNGNITDSRSSVVVSSNSSDSGWISLGSTPDTVTALGNRSYSLVFNSTDHTDTISPGMRLKMTRTVTAPIQCTDLEASSSQYYSKTSPAGMTFTDDFVVSAWVKLESYTGAAQTIVSRYNGTSGWAFQLSSTGQIEIIARNASSGNYRLASSYQSVPLGRWVHIAAQLDMSTYTATTTTCYTMIDGVDVATAVSQSGTNPTALVQAGNLEIGAQNGGTLPFDGKLAQVAIYSAKVTQATILASMHQTLTGSETSLISAYSFNNSITDLNANANNLTANNSAVATNTDSPFAGGNVSEFTDGTTEMGTVMSTAFSTNTTLVVTVPEGYAVPTTGGVSAVSYSTQDTPYGMPTVSNVIGEAIMKGSVTTSSASAVVATGLSATVYLPTKCKVRVSLNCTRVSNDAGVYTNIGLWEGTVGTGTVLTGTTVWTINSGAYRASAACMTATHTPLSSGLTTFNVGYYAEGGGNSLLQGTTYPIVFSVELV